MVNTYQYRSFPGLAERVQTGRIIEQPAIADDLPFHRRGIVDGFVEPVHVAGDTLAHAGLQRLPDPTRYAAG
jgi:hypothetical protein